MSTHLSVAELRQALAAANDERDEARKIAIELKQAVDHLMTLNAELHQDNLRLAAELAHLKSPEDTP